MPEASHEIGLRQLWLELTDGKSTSVQVIDWCHQATSHYLSQFWPKSMSPCGITGPQWVCMCKCFLPNNCLWSCLGYIQYKKRSSKIMNMMKKIWYMKIFQSLWSYEMKTNNNLIVSERLTDFLQCSNSLISGKRAHSIVELSISVEWTISNNMLGPLLQHDFTEIRPWISNHML